MHDYLVFLCPKCSFARYVKTIHKTALCFKCGHHINLKDHRIKILFKAKGVAEAREALSQYKAKVGFSYRL
jgi:acetyl-CoA carboxylase beta subunit